MNEIQDKTKKQVKNKNYKQDFLNQLNQDKSFAVKVILFIQKCCSWLIPADQHNEGYSLLFRSRMVLMAIIVFIMLLIARLLFILTKDVYAHRFFRLKNKQAFSRLEIVDRNGVVLARNILVYDLYLQASRMTNISKNLEIIDKTIPSIIANKQKLLQKLEDRKENGRLVFVKNGLSLKQKQSLIDAGVEGLFFENAEKRFYTSQATNSVVGYCPPNSKCISGIEKGMNSYLKITDNKPLQLSIDNSVQIILRDILKQKVEATNAKGAVGLVMKINTGEIIASVSLPDCDYNNYITCTPEALFNRYSYGVYELGSIFKLFFAGLALREGISPYKPYKRESYQLENFVIHDIDKKELSGGYLNLIDTVRISSNVGCAKIMEDIDIEKQFLFLSRLGLLDRLQTELPELGRPIYPKKWTFTNAVTIAYGHGIAVSPLHFVSALASLLKNEPVRPTFLATNDAEHNNYTYLDEEKLEIFKDIMRQVVNSGGGRSAYIDQYDIGGKTGTADVAKQGKYDKQSTILSFVVATPMYKPEYIFYIMLEKPEINSTNQHWIRGSMLGHTMRQVVATIGPILGIKPVGK